MGNEERVRSPAAAMHSSTPQCSIVCGVLVLATIMSTNLLALYTLFISRNQPSSDSILQELVALKQELQSAQQNLHREQQQPDFREEQSAQQNLHREQQQPDFREEQHQEQQHFPSELLEFTAPRRLPLGRNPNYGLDTMTSPIGHACYSHKRLLEQYMSYSVGDLCPDDAAIAQTLMLRGCEPLPRRRCFSRTPIKPSDPIPLPESLWHPGQDSSVLWTPHSCKSFRCLENRHKNSTVFYDCADCFDLGGRERRRWVNPGDFLTLDDLLHRYGRGRIRIGLDIGGGTGSFAARLLERGVTVVTTTLDLNGPFGGFVAARGLIPIFATIGQRLPFMDNTLDLVHSMHVLSDWIPSRTLEFVLFDVDRVLRPGGFFWLDHFFCGSGDRLAAEYVPMIESVGWSKIRWGVSRKTDRNEREVYLSALLQKPIRGP